MINVFLISGRLGREGRLTFHWAYVYLTSLSRFQDRRRLGPRIA